MAPYETGQPVTLLYTHRVSTQKTGNFGERYGQHLEPAGEYLSHRSEGSSTPSLERDPGFRGDKQHYTRYEHGEITFKNPLVISHENGLEWKRLVHKQFGGKAAGKRLSKKIAAAGYDGIIAYDPKYKNIHEMVNLLGEKKVTHPMPALPGKDELKGLHQPSSHWWR